MRAWLNQNYVQLGLFLAENPLKGPMSGFWELNQHLNVQILAL